MAIGGNAISGPSVFGSTSDQSVLLQANGLTYIEFVAAGISGHGCSYYLLMASSTASFSASTLMQIDSATQVQLGAAFAPLVVIGNNSAVEMLHGLRLRHKPHKHPNCYSCRCGLYRSFKRLRLVRGAPVGSAAWELLAILEQVQALIHGVDRSEDVVFKASTEIMRMWQLQCASNITNATRGGGGGFRAACDN